MGIIKSIKLTAPDNKYYEQNRKPNKTYVKDQHIGAYLDEAESK